MTGHRPWSSLRHKRDVIGTAARDIEAGEEITIALDMPTAIERAADGEPIDVTPPVLEHDPDDQ